MVRHINTNANVVKPVISFKEMIPDGNFWYNDVKDIIENVSFMFSIKPDIIKNATVIIADITWFSVILDANIPDRYSCSTY